MQFTGDQQILLIAGIGYLLVAGIWALTLTARARMLFRLISERVDPELWQELGAPASIKAAMQDPQRRWYRFVQSGDFRRRCDDVVIELIDDFRSRTKRMLIILTVAGILLIVRFWPLFRDSFL